MGNHVSKLNSMLGWLESKMPSHGFRRIHSTPKENKKTPPHNTNLKSSSNGIKIDIAEDKKATEEERLPQNKYTQRTIPEDLNKLLSLLIKEKLHKILENKFNMGIKDKHDEDYTTEYPNITEGTIAKEFKNYLKTKYPENDLRFSFLMITEFVLVSEDPELFCHLASIFFDRQSKFNINLSNEYAQDTIFQSVTEKNFATKENKVNLKFLKLLKDKGKEGDDIVSLNGGLHTVYEEFRE